MNAREEVSYPTFLEEADQMSMIVVAPEAEKTTDKMSMAEEDLEAGKMTDARNTTEEETEAEKTTETTVGEEMILAEEEEEEEVAEECGKWEVRMARRMSIQIYSRKEEGYSRRSFGKLINRIPTLQ